MHKNQSNNNNTSSTMSRNSRSSSDGSSSNNNHNNRDVSNEKTSSSRTTPKVDNHQKYALSFDNVIKGPLKLKGRSGGITKQHKTTAHTQNKISMEKTEAEEKYDTKSMERKKKLIKESAQKSYREKINEFNDKISKLSEYNDLPKV